jgi:uncharacterized protein YcfJ
MNKSMIIGVVLGAGVATAGGTYAGYHMLKESNSAEVLKTLAVTKKIKIPHESCAEHAVVHQKEVKDPNRIAGKAIGAVVGGVLGHQVGGGNGKKVATVAGAVAGGYAGDRVQDNMQKKDTYTTMETRCETTYETKEEVVGYDVTYRIDDKDAVVRMTYDPGTSIPLKNGELVLNQENGTSTR